MAINKIHLDFGHGGSDSGAVNGTVYEKTLNLTVGLMVKEILKDSGFTIQTSRDTDVFINLTPRVEMANKWGADLFVSIHHNSAANKTATGTETLAYSATSKGYNLAKAIQTEAVKTTKMSDRGVKIVGTSITVVAKTTMPAALIEIGFMSNDTDLKTMMTSEFQKNVAIAIATGICNYAGKKLVLNSNYVDKQAEIVIGPFINKTTAATALNTLPSELKKIAVVNEK